MVKVIGITTFAGTPGLNRQRRKALNAERSKIAFPVPCSIVASTTKPVAGSTLTIATPLPVMW
jgi:hypothetical protein